MKSKFVHLLMLIVVSVFLASCGAQSTDSSGDEQNEGIEEANEGMSEEVGSDEAVHLRFGHVLSEESDYHVIATTFAEEVAERSAGSLVIDVFGQGQLGDEAQMVGSAQAGDTALVLTAFAPVSNIVEEFAIFDLPYLFNGFEHANEVLAGEVGDSYFSLLEDHNLISLGHAGAVEFNVYGKEAVHEVSDMNGLRVRVPPSQGYVLSFEALGSQPTPTAYSEVYVGLQQGTLDAGVTSPDQYIQDNFVEVTDYYSLTKTHQQQRLLVMSKAIMDSLTDEQQDILFEAAEIAIEAGKAYYKNSYFESLEEAENRGTEIIEPDIDGFREAIQDVYDKALEDIPNGQVLFEELKEAAS
ncbi:TRAP transporter substrate-binding protein [Alkalihalobacillus oceani]|uniref:TRAP transporter substrate-binding protein n=1 Tax=Halalkalibacter oceani TaxID=1653776 RepID=UPI002040797A|nr:TRAP transporter substrate-binding protein [Halalkalibacter oceani]MCM3760437.1 TRAP transporter substrate-binding protein [Halalkalibacter oceani]